MEDIQYEDGARGPQRWRCELQGQDIAEAGVVFADFENEEELDLERLGVQSGTTTIQIEDAEFFGGKIRVPRNPRVQFGKIPGRGPGSNGNGNGNSNGNSNGNGNRRNGNGGRMLQSTAKTVLVVRIEADDASTSASASTISDDVFGTGSDKINLKERFETCSYGQVVIEPASDSDHITDGVVEVTIPDTVSGASDSTIRNAAVNAATTLLGDLPSQFDHVMLCIPPGTSGGWIAYAYVNSWLSVYNDNWCLRPSGQVHEIGHNLGLAHSGEGSDPYGDESGMMGYSYPQDEDPIMCYNPAKSWQLNWYSDKSVAFDPLAGPLETTLIGIAGYGDSSRQSPEYYVNIKLDGGSDGDYYVGYNFVDDDDINTGTVEAGNTVTLHRKSGSETAYAPSLLLATLDSNQQHVISNYRGSGKDVVIEVTGSISSNGAPIRIYTGCQSVSDCPTGPVCAVPICQSDGSCSLDYSSCNGLKEFEIEILTDNYPGETTYMLIDECSGAVVGSGGPYVDRATTYTETWNVEESRFRLVMLDSYGKRSLSF